MTLDAFVRQLSAEVRKDTPRIAERKEPAFTNAILSTLKRLVYENETVWRWEKQQLGWGSYHWVGTVSCYRAVLVPNYMTERKYSTSLYVNDELFDMEEPADLEAAKDWCEERVREHREAIK